VRQGERFRGNEEEKHEHFNVLKNSDESGTRQTH